MKTKVAVLNGRRDVGNSHVWFDERNVASAKSRRGSLHCTNMVCLVKALCALLVTGLGLVAFAATPTITSVTAQQRYPWNGLVDIVVMFNGAQSDVAKANCDFAVTDTATKKTLDIVHVTRQGEDMGSGMTWTRHFIWDTNADFGEVKIDDVELTVDTDALGGVQFWAGGPYWAECNVGASKPEECGYYFWWGDTVGYRPSGGLLYNDYGFYSNVTWVSSAGMRMSVSPFIQDVCPTYDKDLSSLQMSGYLDASGNLAAKHDAVASHLGAPWRMPSNKEFKDLHVNCKLKGTVQNGVSGQLVTGKDAYMARSIFLPSAGLGFYSYQEYFGEWGSYWSSTPCLNNVSGLEFHWTSIEANPSDSCLSWRSVGLPVRALRPFGAASTHLPLDNRKETRVAEEMERIRFSPAWETEPGMAVATVSINGVVVTNAAEDGVYEWTPKQNGTYVFTHAVSVLDVPQGETLSATFKVTGKEDCVIHFNANGGVFKGRDGSTVKEFEQHFAYGEPQELFTDDLVPMRMDANGNKFYGWVRGKPEITSSEDLINARKVWTWKEDVTEEQFYAVWSTTLTVNFYNCEDKTLLPSSLADHLKWQVVGKGGSGILKSGESFEVGPGEREIMLWVDDGFSWVAEKLDLDGGYSWLNESQKTFKVRIDNDDVTLTPFSPYQRKKDIYVEANTYDEMGKIRFECVPEIDEALKGKIKYGDHPFDESKVHIAIEEVRLGDGTLEEVHAHRLTDLKPDTIYAIPRNRTYIVKSVSYDADMIGGEPYWCAALAGNLRDRVFTVPDESYGTVSIRFYSNWQPKVHSAYSHDYDLTYQSSVGAQRNSLRLAVDASGTVSVQGTLPDGEKLVTTAQAVEVSEDEIYVPVVADSGKGGSISIGVRISSSGAVSIDEGASWSEGGSREDLSLLRGGYAMNLPFDEEAARPKAEPGVWTVDADAVRTAAAESGKLIVILCADYATCGYSQAFAKVAEGSAFLKWAKSNGVYLLTTDASRLPEGVEPLGDATWDAEDMFDLLYWSIPHDDDIVYYPTLAISYAWDPEQAIGFDVARSGEKIGGVTYKGTADTLIAGLSKYLKNRPAADEGENKIVYALRGASNVPENPTTYSSDERLVLAPLPDGTHSFFMGWYPNNGVIEAGSSGVKTFTALWLENRGTCEIDGVEWTYYYEDGGVVVGVPGIGAVPKDTAGEIVIPDKIDGHPVIGIGYGAFVDRKQLTKVRIPASVRVIDKNAFNFASMDFSSGYCPLEGIDVDPANAWFSSEDGILYDHEKETLLFLSPKRTNWPAIVPPTVTRIASTALFGAGGGILMFLGDAPEVDGVSGEARSIYVYYYEDRNGWEPWTKWSMDRPWVAEAYGCPKAVSGFAATQGSSPFGVMLTWTVDPDESVDYTLIRSDVSGGAETILTKDCRRPDGRYLDSTAERGKPYSYSIFATRHYPYGPTGATAAKGERVTAVIGYSAEPFDPNGPVKTYDIRFHANGGVGTMDDLCVTQGLCRVLTENAFVNDGLCFSGWATTSSGGVEHADCEVVYNLGAAGGVVDLYAVWKPTAEDAPSIGMLTVLSENRDPMESSQSRDFLPGQTGPLVDRFTGENPGYVFDGWSFSHDGPVEIAGEEARRVSWNASLFSEIGNASDCNVIRVYAQWKGAPYVIVYEGGGTSVSPVDGEMEDQFCVNGEPVVLASNRFTRAWLTFDCWVAANGRRYAEGEEVRSLWEDGGVSVMKARWRNPVVRLKYDANGGEGQMPTSEYTIFGSNTGVWHPNSRFFRDGYAQVGWSSTPEGDVEWLQGSQLHPDVTWTDGREIVFYAVWRKLVETPIWDWGDCRLEQDEYDVWEKAKILFDGYLIDDNELCGNMSLTIDDGYATATVVEKRKRILDHAVQQDAPSRVDTGDLSLTVGHKGFYGTYGEFEAYGGYNGFGVAGSDEARALESVIGYYTMALSDGTHVQLAVKDKGVVAVSGTFADGAKLSLTAQVVLGEDAFYIPVYALPTKTGDGIRILVKLTVDGEAVTVGSASKVMVDRRGGMSEELSLTASGRIITKIAVKGYDPGTSTACGVDYRGRVIIDDLAYPATFAAKGLPPGLKINADTGVVSGVPTMPGRYAVSVTVTSGVDKSQRTTSEVEMSIDNYTDETMPVEDSYGPFVPGVSMTLKVDGGEGWSVSGLPSGTKWDKSLPGIVGTPTKPGASTVVFNWNEGSLVHRASSTFVVGPLPQLAVSSVGAGTGKVTGAGAYAANAKVTLKATADAKDSAATSKQGATVKSVFAGWYGDADCTKPQDGAVDYRTASYAYVMPSEDVVFYARFIPAADDAANLSVANIAEGEVFTVNGEWQKKIEVNSYSLPSVSVKGLPAGLKFDAKTLTISGKPTKPGTYAVELSLKNVSVKTAKKHTFKIVVPNLESNRITGGVSYRSDAYTYVAGTRIAPILPVLEDGWTLKASGLPAGLKLTGGKNSIPYSIEGTSTAKPGSYTVTLNLTKGKEKDVATITINIENRMLTLAMAVVEGVLTNGCKVTGGGSYAAGKKVTLKATAVAYKKATAKTPEHLATVFAGWYRDSSCMMPLEGAVDFRMASYAYVTKDEDESIYAKFVPATMDMTIGLVVNGENVVDDSGDVRVVVKDATTLPTIELKSLSIPKVSVKGLPTGMKWDAKANRFTGAPTKPGVYKVSMSLTNTTVKNAIVRAFTIEVPNFVSPAFPGLKPESDAYPMSVGVSSLPGVDARLASDYADYTVKVLGLPSGLSWKNGVLTGLAKKAGDYTVTFTATKGKSKQVATITIHVEALPEWAVGTFVGMVRQVDRGEDGEIIEDEDGRHDWYDILTTVSVTSAGKISGKMHFESGTEISFKYDSISERTDDGYLIRGRLTAQGIAAEVELPLRKVWLESTGVGEVGVVDVMIQQTQRQEGKSWVDCEQSTFLTDEDMPLRQNVWTSKTLPLPPNINGDKETVAVGDDVYTLAFGKNGSVKVSLAKVTTPTKAYATGTAMLSILRHEPEVWYCELCVSLVVKKNDYGAACVFDVTISADGTVSCKPR